ncbi:MAG TPA: hypothetical protein VMR23_00515 [Candidatus Limnocylindria bacterium]|nr:hypothetical protein [Candidatus Limnocylindria bacterium]
MDQDQLRLTIRGKLTRGDLPREKCLVTWFGPGAGHPCVACAREIGRHEIECECEQAAAGVLRFHQSCFAIWDDERRNTEGALTP